MESQRIAGFPQHHMYLLRMLQKNFLGSVLLTDGLKGYDGISKKGYKQVIQDNTKVLDGEGILPNVHRIASLLKRWLLGSIVR